MNALQDLQAQVGEWQDRVFPDHNHPHIKACKVGEEAGEVLGAVVKLDDGRKTDEDVQQEIGDAVIALAGLCEVMHYDFESCVLDRWEEVRLRTYTEAHDRGRTTSFAEVPVDERMQALFDAYGADLTVDAFWRAQAVGPT